MYVNIMCFYLTNLKLYDEMSFITFFIRMTYCGINTLVFQWRLELKKSIIILQQGLMKQINFGKVCNKMLIWSVNIIVGVDSFYDDFYEYH